MKQFLCALLGLIFLATPVVAQQKQLCVGGVWCGKVRDRVTQKYMDRHAAAEASITVAYKFAAFSTRGGATASSCSHTYQKYVRGNTVCKQKGGIVLYFKPRGKNQHNMLVTLKKHKFPGLALVYVEPGARVRFWD